MNKREIDAQAACRGHDPELWFPAGEGHGATGRQLLAQTEQARLICSGCPVRAACAQWADDTGQGFGVWGGLTSAQRRAARRARRAATAA